MQTIKASGSLSRQVRRRELFKAMDEFNWRWPRRLRRATARYEMHRQWRYEGGLEHL